MMRFLRKLWSANEVRPERGDTRISYWRNARGEWNWSCQDGNYQVVCGSNQGYVSEAACLDGIENARDAMCTAFVIKRDVAFPPAT